MAELGEYRTYWGKFGPALSIECAFGRIEASVAWRHEIAVNDESYWY